MKEPGLKCGRDVWLQKGCSQGGTEGSDLGLARGSTLGPTTHPSLKWCQQWDTPTLGKDSAAEPTPPSHFFLEPPPPQPEAWTGRITLRESLLTYVSVPKGP